MKRRIAYAFFVALFGAFFANIFNVHVKVPCPKITPVNISNLKRIEKEIFPHQQLKLGKNKNFNYLKPLIDEYDQTNNKKRIGEIEEEILNEYFKVSNQELYNHLDKIEEKLRSNKKDRYITYIHGPAGIGKSFVMKKYKEKYGDDVVHDQLTF